MSLALALNNALSGLRINQQSIAVLSQNIANVNTVGYSRQLINQSAVNVEGIGSGVRIDDITRKIDSYLQRSLQSQGSVNASSQTFNAYFERIQSLLGQPGASNSIDSFLTRFFNSVQQLAETPETNSLKSNAVASAVTLAGQISGLAINVHDLRFEADREIGETISTVNSALDRLRSINAALVQSGTLGQSNTGLLDDRDRELRKLSDNLNISVTFANNGVATVVGGDGAVLLEDGVRHQIAYARASSVDSFINDARLGAVEVLSLDNENREIGNRVTLISGGPSEAVRSTLASGKLAALQQVRDVKFPSILEQLDGLASRLRDQVNTIHNKGSGFPAATSLSGDRVLRAGDQTAFLGSVRIAVLQQNGSPVVANYADEAFTGIRPLTLNLSQLDAGQGNGKPTVQTIIDEINNHFGAPGNKAKLGNINNIQLASNTGTLPSGAPPLFNFDLDLENISSDAANVFVTSISVRDDTAANITNVTQTAPSFTISGTNSYTTTNGSADVTINLTAIPNVAVGDRIFLNPPSAAVNGIAAANLGGFFTVTAVSGTNVTFTAAAAATATGSVNDPGAITGQPKYDTITPGDKRRTREQGQLQVDFSANQSSAYYDITVNVSVIDAAGVVSSAPITYRVVNNRTDLLNQRYDAQSVGGAGTLVQPLTSQPSLRAVLVDADGNELPTLNGKYIDGPGFLKIIGGTNSTGESYSIAIDELNSDHVGKPDANPPESGTRRGFSHYFGLNNFFEANLPTISGDATKGSAVNLRVEDRIANNANLISIGSLVQQPPNVASGNRTLYTYVRFAGDNSIAQQFAKLNAQTIAFEAAGGLPSSEQSLQGYTSQLLGFVSQRSAEARDNAANAQTLFDGFQSRSDASSGVNLDEELANTVTFQNAYSATARVITLVNELYEALINAF